MSTQKEEGPLQMMGLEELQSVQESLIKKLKQTNTLIESRRTNSVTSLDSDRPPKQPKHQRPLEAAQDRMRRVKEQAKQELRGFLDDESTSPVGRRLEEPRPIASIPAKETLSLCDDLLGQKLAVFRQIKQRFEDSKGLQESHQSHEMFRSTHQERC